MASRYIPDKITCPYNKFHQIDPKRITYHLIKCKKNYPDVELAVCAYNATHQMPPDEEKAHLKECPDKKIAEVQKYNVPLPGQHGCLKNPNVFGSSFIPQASNDEIDDTKFETESTVSSLNRSRYLSNFIHHSSGANNDLDSDASGEVQRILGSSGNENMIRSSPKLLRRPKTLEPPGNVQRRSSPFSPKLLRRPDTLEPPGNVQRSSSPFSPKPLRRPTTLEPPGNVQRGLSPLRSTKLRSVIPRSSSPERMTII